MRRGTLGPLTRAAIVAKLQVALRQGKDAKIAHIECKGVLVE